MKHWFTTATVVALCSAIAGCDARSEAPESPATPAPATTNTSAQAPKPAPANPAPTAPAAAEEEELTQDTAEGTVRLFAQAMRDGDFDTVVELTDPASEAYEDFVSMAENFNPDSTASKAPREIIEAVASMFTSPWKDITITKIGETEGRAKFEVLFGGVDPSSQEAKAATRVIEVSEFQGVWRVLASKELLRPPGQKPPAGFPFQESRQPQQPAGPSQ